MASQSKRIVSRREFLRFGALGAGAVLLAACQPKVVEKEVEKIVTVVEGAPTVAPKEKVHIRDLMWGVSAQSTAVYEGMARAFMERNPHITVEMLLVPEANFAAKIQTSVAAGDPPELVLPFGGAINTFRGPDFSIWLDLQPFIDRESFDLSDFAQSSLDAAVHPFTQAMEGIPVQIYPGSMVYNKDMLAKYGVEEPPQDWEQAWTLEQFEEAALQLTRDKNDRSPLDAGFDPDSIVQYGVDDSNSTAPWARMFGGHDFRTSFDDRRNVLVDSPETIAGWTRWADLVHKRRAVIKLNETAEWQGMLPSVFNSGKIGLWCLNCWDINKLVGITEFEWDFAAPPKGPSGAWNTRLCLDQGCITADSKFHEASWEWLKYWTEPEINATGAVDGRDCLPSRLSVRHKYAERLALKRDDVNGNVVAEGASRSSYAECWHPPSAWGEIWNPYRDRWRRDGEEVEPLVKEGAALVRKNWDEYFARFGM